jgi:hypothetical protein
MILQATTRCVLHQQGWQAFAFDLYRAMCVSHGKRSSFLLMPMQNLQPGVLKLPNFQVLIATSCSDCKIARIISKPQPWRRTESSDRNALLQVVCAASPCHSSPHCNAIFATAYQLPLAVPPSLAAFFLLSLYKPHPPQAGRALGGTHFFAVDTDELPSAMLLSLDVWWEMVLALLPRQNLALPLIEVP